MVTAALADGYVDKASVLMYAETHNQLTAAAPGTVLALLDEVSEGVLSACLIEPYSQREKALARLVARLAMHPFPQSAAMIGR
jgi:hypothetical protein